MTQTKHRCWSLKTRRKRVLTSESPKPRSGWRAVLGGQARVDKSSRPDSSKVLSKVPGALPQRAGHIL
jgi:hypothetical protein